MKLKFEVERSQPDPYIFEDGGRFYLYVTAHDGVEAYSAASLTDIWQFEGVVLSIEGCSDFWAPCIVKIGDFYHIYVSCNGKGMNEFLHTARARTPLGPFSEAKCLFDRFTIDAHVVQTDCGLYLWYAEDNRACDRIGTRIFVDRLLDPYTPANQPKEAIVPTFDEEIFMRNRYGDGRDWHTIEGPFWFAHEGWQYVMYSGGCFENDSYHIGYAAAKTDESDLLKVDFVKHTKDGTFDPLLFRCEFEEGVGHHSIICLHNAFYAIYHGRDLRNNLSEGCVERRTARICRLHVKDGTITAERYEDHL